MGVFDNKVINLLLNIGAVKYIENCREEIKAKIEELENQIAEEDANLESLLGFRE